MQDLAPLYGAIAKAQAHAKNVEKDKTNTFHRYAYASAEAMISEAKDALSVAELAIIPAAFATVPPTESQAQAGACQMLESSWLLVHSSGTSLPIALTWPVILEKGRPFDKALAGARTGSLSYLLRDLLQLPRVDEADDLDHDSRDTRDQGRQTDGAARVAAAKAEAEAKVAANKARLAAEKARAESAMTPPVQPPAADAPPQESAQHRAFDWLVKYAASLDQCETPAELDKTIKASAAKVARLIDVDARFLPFANAIHLVATGKVSDAKISLSIDNEVAYNEFIKMRSAREESSKK